MHLWLKEENPNLLEGMYHIAEYGFPNFDRDSINDALKEMSEKISRKNQDKSTREKVQMMNQVILYDYGFNGDLENYSSLNNSFINRTFQKRRSNPIGLSIIYLLLAKELNIPIIGINSPGHFILGVLKDTEKSKSIIDIDYFIDPFNNGTEISKYDYLTWLKKRNLDSDELMSIRADDKDIIRRVFNNLIYALFTQGEKETANKLQTIVDTL